MAHNKVLPPRPYFSMTLLSAAIVAAMSSSVYAQSNNNPISNSQVSTSQVDELEDVVVYGIRNSLKTSADFKKNSAVVVDSITAEDIGKFPDANVADSLQRVTGIQISRDRGGEGRFVSVRGLGSQFNMTLLNGRTLATDNSGRDFSFDVMPSEAISGADIYKASMASLQEGSIGGLISLKTLKPLDNPGLHIKASAGQLYDDGTEKFSGQYSGIVSNSFMDDTLGASFGLTYSKRHWKADTYESFTERAISTADVDVDGDGNNDAVNAWAPDIITMQHKFGERERIGAVGALQFKPDERIDTTLDFFYSNYKTPERSYSYNINFGTASDFSYSALQPWSTPAEDDGVPIDYIATGFSAGKANLEIGNDTQERETDTYMIGWNTIFQATDALELTMDLAYSKAERPNKGDNMYTVAGINEVAYEWQTTAKGVPMLDCMTPDGRACWDINNEDIAVHFMELKGEQVIDEAVSFRFDGDYDFNFMALDSKLEFGVTYSTREKDKAIYKTANGCSYCSSFNRRVSQVGITAVLPEAVNYDAGFDTGISYWPALDPYALFAALRSFDRIEGQEGRFETQIAPQLRERESTVIEEQVAGGYLQANVSGDQWNAIAGVRWVQTDTTSSGHIQDLKELQKIPGSSNYQGVYGDSIAVSEENTYDNFLPSININYDLQDNLKLRASASQTITRPTISQLGPDLNWEINSGTPRVSFGGNPALEPIKSNNYDLSLEWYGENGSSASVAGYYKDISNFIFWAGETLVYNITVTEEGAPPITEDVEFGSGRPYNGDTATLTGVELALQQLFDNGFGVQFNYTWADSTSNTTVGDVTIKGELDGVSTNTYNLMGFYETDSYSARLSYSYRDAYVAGARSGKWGNPLLNNDYASLDLSLSYDINDNVEIYLEAQNLLEEYNHRYYGDFAATKYYEQYSRRFELGARFSF